MRRGWSTFLGEIRSFLERRPDNVIILFDEDYVSERDLREAFVRAKLFDRLAVLNRNQPLPTLGELIRSRHNVIVFAQKETSGHYPWNQDAFRPGFRTRRSASRSRPSSPASQAVGEPLEAGGAGNPLLMMNNWADIFPPRPEAERAAPAAGVHPPPSPAVHRRAADGSRT